MELSLRLRTICNMIDNCKTIADIGTDHGYIPIYLIKNKMCEFAIACDINKGPLEKAEENIKLENLEDNISLRLGSGFDVITPGEANVAIIAGMGGHLIKDLIESGMEVFKSLDYLILQPVQNPDVLRKYIYDSGFEVVKEELCIDEKIFYEIIKIRYANANENIRKVQNDIFYEVSYDLIKQKHPLVNNFIQYKINRYRNILEYIQEDSSLANLRKKEVKEKIHKLEELLR
ncbi:class I SAM-dependent methyltransferase [Clostridium sp. HMP27]|uniref:tRNA (adenine(22)-N(1))-methyltransferase n=1 Tax=Clostridium sp. HMP27 TaxID=1487921 RepID=UPI00052D0FBB|nr:class I SAM-dependent methyltransferase [Clostridium sp. HMP27]KGK87995.1 SAM-dependent methyltransferase [Clostridium sp. HMP27]